MVIKNKIAVLGATGLIGSWVYKTLKDNGYDVVGTKYHSLKSLDGLFRVDISYFNQLKEFINLEKPDIIINCVGMVGKELCNLNKEESNKSNFLGVKNLAELCRENEIKLIHFSTIVVHNGLKQTPYLEEDNPTERIGDLYNEQKSKAESFVEKVPNSIIIRL